MKKFAILFTSRNCYELFEPIFWKKSGNLENFLILNVDCGSSVEQLSRRDELIKKYGIIDLTIKDDPNIKSTERALELAAFYLSVHCPEIEWIFHAQNDGYFYKTENFALEFEKFLKDNPEVNQAGMIGFTSWNYLDLNVPGYGRGNLVAGVFAAPYPGH